MSKMKISELKGWIRNGPDFKQNFQGWIVYANKPKFPVTPVIITLRKDSNG